jgi:hypothetical protein
MKAQVLTGSKDQIARTFAQINGEVHEVIVFVEEPSPSTPESASGDIFAEMEPFTVHVGGADYSRESLCARLERE